MKPICPDCGDRHEKYQAHVFKVAINKRPAINTTAINKAINVVVNGAVPEVVLDAVVSGKTPNRRDRKAYNEYMRGYMKKLRAK